MDFGEAAKLAVAKRKFLLNRLMQKKLLPEDNGKEEVEEEVETWVSHVTLIRVWDSRVLVIICKMPHKMSCYNQLLENDQKVVCKKAYHKKYYAKNRERILAQQKRYHAENVKILKTRRKRWYEIDKKRLASSQRAYC